MSLTEALLDAFAGPVTGPGPADPPHDKPSCVPVSGSQVAIAFAITFATC